MAEQTVTTLALLVLLALFLPLPLADLTDDADADELRGLQADRDPERW